MILTLQIWIYFKSIDELKVRKAREEFPVQSKYGE